GELVGLARQHADGELFAREISSGQLESFGRLGLVLVDDARALVGTPRLELLDRVLGEVLLGLAGGVVVSSHAGGHSVWSGRATSRAARGASRLERRVGPRPAGPRRRWVATTWRWDCASFSSALHSGAHAGPLQQSSQHRDGRLAS